MADPLITATSACSRSAPVLSFPGGVPSAALRFSAASPESLFSASLGAIALTAEAAPQAAAADFVVCVVQPESGTAEVCPPSAVRVVRQSYPSRADGVSVDRRDVSYGQQKRGLIDAFGSRKKQRAQAQVDFNVISADGISNLGSLTRRLGNLKSPAPDQEAASLAPTPDEVSQLFEESMLKTLPRMNTAALQPEDVFRIVDVCGGRAFHLAMDRLKAAARGGATREALSKEEMAVRLRCDEETRVPGWLPQALAELVPAATGHRLPVLAARKMLAVAKELGEWDEARRKHGMLDEMTAAAMYSFYVALYHAPDRMSRPLPDIADELGIPDDVAQTLLRRFRVVTRAGKDYRYGKAKEPTDSLIMHVLAAALLLGQTSERPMEIDVAEVAADLRMDPAHVASRFQLMGCKKIKSIESKGAAPSFAVRLVTPVVFPKVRRGRTKG